jgi:hypothetical protein
MRRAVLLSAAALGVAVAAVVAPMLATAPAAVQHEVHITRLFIPAIKADCRERANIPEDGAAQIGYTFDREGALTTIDRDGRLTGIDAGRLITFNTCLAQYPIERISLPPHDHYSRNLLYDYFSSSLEPCLRGRVDLALPELPTRADFVVRLYNWDPYRFVAPGRGLAELLDLAAECPALPPFMTAD